jgi:thiamine pyrophosphokinase
LFLLYYTFHMLGIAFTGGEGPSPETTSRIVEEARSKGEVLLAAADSGLILAEKAGIKPDWVIGDMDSLLEYGKNGLLDRYPAEKVRRYPRDKDFTDTELVLRLLWDNACDEIWLLGGGGGRLDHLLAIRSLFERERCPSRWVTAHENVRILEGPGVCSARLAPGATVSLLPLGEGPWDAASQGLKWSLSGLPWTRGFIAISNVAPDGPFTVEAGKGRFMVMWAL